MTGRIHKLLRPVLAAVLLLYSASLQAAPTTANHARAAVRAWLASDSRPLGAAMGRAVLDTQTFTDDRGEPIYYVVYVEPSGYLIVSADDDVEPIIAFAPQGHYDPTPENPFYLLATRDLTSRTRAARAAKSTWRINRASTRATSARGKWSRLLRGASDGPSIMSLGSVSDMRVPPFVQSRWSQSAECGNACYNYYTPPNAEGSTSNHPCGCVATAMAQTMRYFQYPTVGVGTTSFSISVCGSSQSRSLRGGNGSGGPYSWADMVLDPDCSTALGQRQAIGALCADAGVAVNMDYCSDGSGAYAASVVNAMKSTFKYSNATLAYKNGNEVPATAKYKAINANLHAGYPVMLAIAGNAGGHMIVCDGYGYNTSTMYHHLNMGWAGTSDAWYNLPTIDAHYAFDTVNGIVYNTYTSGAGEIIAGRVTDSTGASISGATVTAGSFSDTTDSYGVYALVKVLSNHAYTVSVAKAGYTFTSRSVTTGTSNNNTTTVGNLWDIDFTGSGGPPPTPVDGTPTADSTTGITWRWTDVPTETGYRVRDTGGVSKSGDLAANTVSWSESGLTANTQYTRRVYAFSASGESSGSTGQTTYTLAKAGEDTTGSGATGNVRCATASKSTWYGSGKTFTFSNTAGFGMGGEWKASKFEYKWNKIATETWAAAGTTWSSGTISQTANAGDGYYYLHVRAFNGDNAANNTNTLDCGPFWCDVTSPSAVTVTDEGAWTPSLTQLKASWTASNDGSGSGVNRYEYAVGTTSTTQDIKGWTPSATSTSATIAGLVLFDSQQYFVQVRAVDGMEQMGTASAANGIKVAPVIDPISDAWARLDTADGISLRNRVVTAALPGAFWLEESNRTSGIKVVSAASVAQGNTVSVAGVLGPSGPQRALIGDVVVNLGGSASLPEPLYITQRYLGGAAFNAGTPGVMGGRGLYNIGLLVRCAGQVTYYNTADPQNKYFVFDDGSGLLHSGHPGVKVRCGTTNPPASGWAVVTGISASEWDADQSVPVILIRGPSDIVGL